MSRARSLSIASFFSIAVLVCLALAQTAGANPPWGRHHGPPPGHSPGDLFARHAERLGLDDATLAKIQAIVADSGAKNEKLEAAIRDGRKAMWDLLSSSPKPDTNEVMAKADALGALETQAHKNRLAAILQIRALLTPEQVAELERIRAERGPHHRFGPLGRCSGDLADLCTGATAGLPTVDCLRAHWSDLSDDCRDAFDPKAKADWGWGPPDGEPDAPPAE